MLNSLPLKVALREADAALRAKDYGLARSLLEPLAQEAEPSSPLWFLLAQTYGGLQEIELKEQTVDRMLAADSRDINALILKGDCLVSHGKDRHAAVFYSTALRVAGSAFSLTPQTRSRLHAAEHALSDLHIRFQRHLQARLQESGLPQHARPPRFQHALDLLEGKRARADGQEHAFPQQPTTFFYPELPHRQFFERSEFDWLPEIESAAALMREELETIIADEAAFAPYMSEDSSGPRNHHALVNDPQWSAFFLCKDGKWVEENARRCPQTVAALSKAPLPWMDKRSPNILFSLLKPGAHIPPHTGILNTQLICHIPLITNEHSLLRVGSEQRGWRFGEALIFDDSIEHEAWNRGIQTRVVLLFDIWRPELTEQERSALRTLLSAIEDYGR